MQDGVPRLIQPTRTSTPGQHSAQSTIGMNEYLGTRPDDHCDVQFKIKDIVLWGAWPNRANYSA
jgi:hypothetical protein